MARKAVPRTYSKYTDEALKLLGKMIKMERIEREVTAQDLAERAGISRDMLWRIEKGDPKCGIGVVFELAAIVGIRLFDSHSPALTKQVREVDDRLALLPKAVRKPTKVVDDEF